MNSDASLTVDEQRRVDAFLQLSRLERGLRAFIEFELRRIDGPKWTKSLPADVREKTERRGIAHADFADLKKVLGSSWRKLGSRVKGARKEQVLNHLEGLEPVRNDIAHSRDVSEGSLALVQAAYFVVGSLIGVPEMSKPLPPTSHPSVALERLRGAISHSSQVAEVDMETLRGQADQGRLCRLIDEYERVRKRPGRDLDLLATTRSNAIDALDASLAVL